MNVRGSILLVAVLLGAVMACEVSARPKIPEETIISNYDPLDYGFSAQQGTQQGAGSGPATAFTQADLRRLRVVSSAYPKTLAVIDEVMSFIADRSPRPGLRPEVQLFNSVLPEARAINQDLIVLSTGYLDLIQKEYAGDGMEDNAIAFILAHEYAHLLFDHPAEYAKKLESTVVKDDLMRGVGVVQSLQAIDSSVTGERRNEYAEAQGVLMAATAASPWLETELYRAVYAPYVKKAEQQADYMAIDLLSVESESLRFDAKAGASPFRGIYKTYDQSMRSRLQALGKEFGEVTKEASEDIIKFAPAAAISGASGAQIETLVKASVIRSVAPRLMKGLKNRLNRNKVHIYYSADDRVDAIDEYAKAFYPQSLDSLDAGMAAMLGLMEAYEAEHTSGAAADQAFEFIARGDLGGARQALERVAGMEAENLDDVHYLLAWGALTFGEGRLSEAITWYRRAIRNSAADAPPDAYKNLASAHFRTGNTEKAIEAVNLGIELFSVEEFIVQKVRIVVTLEDPQKNAEALAECRSIYDEALIEQCEAIANPKPPEQSSRQDEEAGEEKKIGRRLRGVLDSISR